MEWIDIEKELPEYDEDVLICSEYEGCSVASRCKDVDGSDKWITEIFVVCFPTHWMELPELPKTK